jgi:predicted metallo-beta-lactamase superfamily hydrolase
LQVELVWFDSLGAKSACILVRASCGVTIVVDPGVAVMHPSFPASSEAKEAWYREGLGRVIDALRRADVVVVTHYHHDHYLWRSSHLALYTGKTILAKNPNSYINESQRGRAVELYESLYRLAGVEEVYAEPAEEEFPDPTLELREALSKSFGDYDKRRRELLERGREWFRRLSAKWTSWPRVREANTGRLRVYWADGRSFEFGCVRIRFTGPLFHGVEYSRVGWVVAAVIEADGTRLFYSSDVNGPIIEDYASLIAREKPDMLILDGPPTYMLGYMLNKTNLLRAIENGARIVSETERLQTVVYDHHLVREPRFRERTKPVWDAARRRGVNLATAAEHLGLVPAVLRGQ